MCLGLPIGTSAFDLKNYKRKQQADREKVNKQFVV